MVRELGWARRPEDHLHDPDDETVAADQRDAQDGKQKHDQEDEQAGLVPLGRGDRGAGVIRRYSSLFYSDWHIGSLVTDQHRAMFVSIVLQSARSH